MKILFFLAIVMITSDGFAQLRGQEFDHYTLVQPVLNTSAKTFIPGLHADPIRNFRPRSPMMNSSSSYDWRMPNNFFWAGTVTTMSYNKGKFGTYLYWDVQGNLRSTRGFIDISGKNKRGLKLTFLWRSFTNNKF
jgi:hypothetical protein